MINSTHWTNIRSHIRIPHLVAMMTQLSLELHQETVEWFQRWNLNEHSEDDVTLHVVPMDCRARSFVITIDYAQPIGIPLQDDIKSRTSQSSPLSSPRISQIIVHRSIALLTF
ncbi:hypothetical protein CC2G_000214 [Coprinopsis cinerea AmutBmut pab1-1]|nr:hypothetical protein CC2G_000214 [Coprinopsis cinerea AmutBmut pab1-1]